MLINKSKRLRCCRPVLGAKIILHFRTYINDLNYSEDRSLKVTFNRTDFLITNVCFILEIILPVRYIYSGKSYIFQIN